ncbi:tyrosine-type recombinase/integrase [Tessaracoccus sp. Y36]
MARNGNGEGSTYKYDGRWYKQGYIDEGNGLVRRKSSAKTRAGAREAWTARLERAEKGSRRVGQPRNIAELLEVWLERKTPDIRYSTITGYRHTIDAHIVPRLGSLRPTELTVAAVETWQFALSQHLASSTVRQARSILKQAFDMAVRHRDVHLNPVTSAVPLKKSALRVKAMTEGQARTLLGSIPPGEHQTRARVSLALTLGLRQGELLALTWDDIVLDGPEPQLQVRATLQRQTGRGLVRVEPKTERSRRSIRLSDGQVKILKAHRAAQLERKLLAGGSYNAERFVFVSGKGTPIDPGNDRQAWYRQLRAAGLPEFRVHAARHTAATLLLKVGLDSSRVQQILGHSSIRTTIDTYGHLSVAETAEGVAKVAALLAI